MLSAAVVIGVLMVKTMHADENKEKKVVGTEKAFVLTQQKL